MGHCWRASLLVLLTWGCSSTSQSVWRKSMLARILGLIAAFAGLAVTVRIGLWLFISGPLSPLAEEGGRLLPAIVFGLYFFVVGYVATAACALVLAGAMVVVRRWTVEEAGAFCGSLLRPLGRPEAGD